jgi:fructose-bisphosphate aldolase, class I
MSFRSLEAVAKALLVDGKGILAADETIGTLTKRFTQLEIQSTPETRRDYRALLFETPHAADFVSGVIMYDETIRQRTASGKPLINILLDQGVIPGIKVDSGAKPLAGCKDENVTEGLDGLRERLEEYHAIGAQFAKWRAVIRISDKLPSKICISVNAHALGRYAALCQEQQIVPIVEPEVLMEGAHTIQRCEQVTGEVLNAVFNELYRQGVSLEGVLLKPNMVLPGSARATQASVAEVADATLRCLHRHVSAAVPGIVFLSGGQTDVLATTHLNAINSSASNKPWKISFSYGRALQDMALATWLGDQKNYRLAQQAYYHRAKCNGAASVGKYAPSMEDLFRADRPIRHVSDEGDD